MRNALYSTIQDEILELKKRRNAVILAHNYQVGAIQDIADLCADSLKLAQFASRTDADVILLCGVHFMAETASILCPDRRVLVPDLEAGCSLANMIDAEALKKWKLEHPEAVVVAYVNTTAAVKALSDYCCTSTNALKVVNSIPADREVLFIPDFFLGRYVQKLTGRTNMHLWSGYCTVHARIKDQDVKRLRCDHPGAEYVMHPECGCLTGTMHLADRILSTEGMIRYAKESSAKEFIIATETGILHRLQQDNPEKRFYPAAENAVCEHMKRNTLEKVADSLEKLQHEVRVPPDLARQARLPIERMLAIS